MSKSYKIILGIIGVAILLTLGLWKNSQYQVHNGNVINAIFCNITGGEYGTRFESNPICGNSKLGCTPSWKMSDYMCQK